MSFKFPASILIIWLIACKFSLAQQQSNSVKVDGETYHLRLDSSGFYLWSASKRFRLADKDNYYFMYEVVDFNQDGFKDILLYHGSSNTPAIFSLLEYVAYKKKFIAVRNFNKFPDPKPIYKTDYYYSYHHNGCADACWESDLFYIKNYKAIRVANIDCEFTEGDKGAISIYKVISSKRILIKILRPEVGDKWQFIKRYWFENYRRFQ